MARPTPVPAARRRVLPRSRRSRRSSQASSWWGSRRTQQLPWHGQRRRRRRRQGSRARRSSLRMVWRRWELGPSRRRTRMRQWGLRSRSRRLSRHSRRSRRTQACRQEGRVPLSRLCPPRSSAGWWADRGCRTARAGATQQWGPARSQARQRQQERATGERRRRRCVSVNLLCPFVCCEPAAVCRCALQVVQAHHRLPFDMPGVRSTPPCGCAADGLMCTSHFWVLRASASAAELGLPSVALLSLSCCVWPC